MRLFPFTTDAVGPDEEIRAQTFASQITVYENNQAGTQDYIIKDPLDSTKTATIPAGAKHVFPPPGQRYCFYPGELVAYIAAAAGSLSMIKEENA